MRAVSLVIGVALVVAASPVPKVYHNEEFGITLPIPGNTLRCAGPPGEHDEGALLLLGTADAKRCHERDHRRDRYVGVFASYQVDETKTLLGFLASVCDDACERPPGVWRIAGLRTEAGETVHPDGSIDIHVVTQSGKPDPAFDPAVPSINYDLSLHTSPKNLAEDLRVFREVLRTVKLPSTQWKFVP